MNNVERFLSELKVYDTGLTKMRLGPKNDGGYVVFKEACEKSDSLYTYGVGDDVGFELDIINKFPNIEKVFLHDPTIDDLPEQNGRFKFIKNGIENTFKFSKEHSPTLKIDVEFNEWEALSNIHFSEIQKANQIIIEFHLVHVEPKEGLTPYFHKFYSRIYNDINNNLFEYYFNLIHDLNKIFTIGHIHVNNSLPLMNMSGHSIPPLIEVTFVNMNMIKKENHIPGFITNSSEFDSPNKIDRPDVVFVCN